MRDCRNLPHCITILLNCSGSAIAKFRGDTLSDQKAQVQFSRDFRCSSLEFAAGHLAAVVHAAWAEALNATL